MRIAIVSDIHGNRTAFEAVLADLRWTSPDLILHGGDLADGGSRPAEIVDGIRDLGWQGVAGNADEMLWRPEALTEFATQSPGVRPLLNHICETAAATREAPRSIGQGSQSGALHHPHRRQSQRRRALGCPLSVCPRTKVPALEPAR